MREQWLPVKGYEGRYDISDAGRVKSLSRFIANGRKFNDHIMKLFDHVAGYKVVWLRKGNLHKKFFIHRLVAKAFIPNPHKKEIVNHINENKQDNRVNNLEWMTSSENISYYYRMRGERKKEILKEIDHISELIIKGW